MVSCARNRRQLYDITNTYFGQRAGTRNLLEQKTRGNAAAMYDASIARDKNQNNERKVRIAISTFFPALNNKSTPAVANQQNLFWRT